METTAAIKDTVDKALLAEYGARLTALRYDTVGLIEALTFSPCPDEHVAVDELKVVPGEGVEGQYPGKQWWQGRRVPGRQISAVSADVLDALGVAYDVPGDNLIVRGIDLAAFAPGDVLRVGDALLRVTPTPHRPCAKLARRTSLTAKTAIADGRCRGILLDAVQSATIRVGDPVERLLVPMS